MSVRVSVCFLVEVRRKGLAKVHEVQEQSSTAGKLVSLGNKLQKYEGGSLIGCPNFCTQEIQLLHNMMLRFSKQDISTD